MTRRQPSMLIAIVCAFWLAACAGPSYRTEYYTLTADHSVMEPTAADKGVRPPATDASLGVGPIRLPEMLDQVGIVSWDDSQRVYVAPYAVWAGDLREAVSRVLADDLSRYLETHRVWPFPWDNRVRPERQLSVVVERFGGERGGEVGLRAKWRLLSSDGTRLLDSGKISLTTDAEGSSYNAYVAALNDLLHQFARQLAEIIRSQA